MAMSPRYVARRSARPGMTWLVIDTQTDEVVETYSRRTNWIDGRDGKPYGPAGAAEERAVRLNEEVEGD